MTWLEIRTWLYANTWFNRLVAAGRWVKRVVRWCLLPSAERKRDTVSLSTLVNHRFGNQLFQYMFIRMYAEQHGCRYETTPWAGEDLFQARAPRMTRKLPEFKVEVGAAALNAEPLNVDFRGFFQFDTACYAPYREKIHEWFQPAGLYAEHAAAALRALQARGRTLVGLHIRRGDYGYAYFFLTPNGWYRAWLASFWSKLEDPVLFVASDQPEHALDGFSEFSPVTLQDLDLPELPRHKFYADFYLLTQVAYLGISNSSFSFGAAMLNEHLKEAVRPVLSEQKMIPFDPWDAPPVLRDDWVEHFPHVKGIRKEDYTART